MSGAVINVSATNFEAEVLKSDIPVVVDFYADWCGPCRTMGPILEQLADELKSKVKIVKVNVDENPDLKTKYGVRGIPHLIMFKQGEAFAGNIGFMPKANVREWIATNLDASRPSGNAQVPNPQCAP